MTENINTRETVKGKHLSRDSGQWRDKLSFWIIGFNYKFGNYLILSAAHDIIHNFLPEAKSANPPRHCHEISTGVILLLNVVPAHLMLFIMPLIPIWFRINTTVYCSLNILSYTLLAFGNKIYLALLAIVINSVAFGISENILSKKVIQYPSKVIFVFTESAYSSCYIATFYYACLRELNISYEILFLALIPFQFIVILCSLFLLRKPIPTIQVQNITEEDSEFPLSIFSLQSLAMPFDKCEYFCYLLKYIVPLSLIVLVQFVINQGFYEFVYFRNNFLSIEAQYRWNYFIFQVGVYACLKTKTLLVIKHIWIYTILIFLLAFYFILDAIYFFTSYLWVFMLLIYFEGIFCGAAYINTMQKMESEESINRLDIAETFMKQSLSLSSILGGGFAVLSHFFLIRTPEPKRP